jgi:MinD superfamily P-loop ATPase
MNEGMSLIMNEGMSLIMNDKCTRCGISFRRAMFMAAMQDAGASTSVNPLQCDDVNGKMVDHDFQPRGTK